jgi:ATP-binding cassette subfamily B protein
MWRYPKYVVITLVALPLTILVNSFLPALIVANILNKLSTHTYQTGDVWGTFGTSLILYTVLVIVGSRVGWRVVDICNWRLESRMQRDMAQRIYNHLLAQSATFHANHFSGSLVSQTNKFLGGAVRLADTTTFQVLPLFASLVFASIILSKRAPVFVAALLGFSVFYIVIAFFVTKPVRRASTVHAGHESSQTGYLADSITNVMAIKSFASGTFERSAFAGKTQKTADSLLAVMRLHNRQQSIFGTIISVIMAASLMLTVMSVVWWGANIATAFLILSYTTNIIGQLFTFSNSSLRTYNRALGDAKEMTEILNITPEVQDPAKPEKLRMKQGEIVFNNVTFSHDGADDALFDNLNLHIEPGQKVGLVGHSGSGKTSLTRILLRFSDIDDGSITIDGQNVAHVSQDDLRHIIAYVPQEPLLFHRTIKENIAYGMAGASDEQVYEAARKANADEFIAALPNGYDTLVGERGVKLSGGQRQRVVIARSILKNAPVLVLDEATSALDSESELLIQQSLQELMKNRTAIVIAHRLSTIQKMDRILVLENGQIIEDGSHTKLLKLKGVYAQLWAHQSGGFIED